MGHQPEYCQPHNHEQTELALSFGWQKAEQTIFHRFVCRNLLNPERLISHVITPKVFQMFLCYRPADDFLCGYHKSEF